MLTIIKPLRESVLSINVQMPAAFLNRNINNDRFIYKDGQYARYPIHDDVARGGGFLPTQVVSPSRLGGVHVTDASQHLKVMGDKPNTRPPSVDFQFGEDLSSMDVLMRLFANKAPVKGFPPGEYNTDHYNVYGQLTPTANSVPGYYKLDLPSTYMGSPMTYIRQKRLSSIDLRQRSGGPTRWHSVLNYGSLQDSVDILGFYMGLPTNYTYNTNYGSNYTCVSKVTFRDIHFDPIKGIGYVLYDYHTDFWYGRRYQSWWTILRTYEVTLPTASKQALAGVYGVIAPIVKQTMQIKFVAQMGNDANAHEFRDISVESTGSGFYYPTRISEGTSSITAEDVATHLLGGYTNSGRTQLVYQGGLFRAAQCVVADIRSSLNTLARSSFAKAVKASVDGYGKGSNLVEAALEIDRLYETMVNTPETVKIILDEVRVPKWAKDAGIKTLAEFKALGGQPQRLKHILRISASSDALAYLRKHKGFVSAVKAFNNDLLRVLFGFLPTFGLLEDIPAVAEILARIGSAYSGVSRGSSSYEFGSFDGVSAFSNVSAVVNSTVHHSFDAGTLQANLMPFSAAGFAPWQVGTFSDLIPNEWFLTQMSETLRRLKAEGNSWADSVFIGVDHVVMTARIEFEISLEYLKSMGFDTSILSTADVPRIIVFIRRIFRGIPPTGNCNESLYEQTIGHSVTMLSKALVTVL